MKDTYLYREIHEQPAVLRRLLEREHANVQKLVSAIKSRAISHVVVSARGTSDNAARYAQYLLGSINRLTVALALPSLYSVYRTPPHLDGALVIGISQSGKSPDNVSVLAKARSQGALTVVITNDDRSDLAKEAEYVLGLEAGIERSVAATKTYTAELALIALLSVTLAGDASMFSILYDVPTLIEETLAASTDMGIIAQRWRDMEHCAVLGRGYNYATAFELALKIEELAYIFAEPYSSADFLHGPLAIIHPGFPVIMVAPSGMILPEMRTLAHEIRNMGSETIVISDDPHILAAASTPIVLSRTVPEWISPLITIIPGQLFVMHLASLRGNELDNPRAICKVTETI